MLASVTSQEFEILTRTLINKRAVYIGETALASTCVHSINSNFDGNVFVNFEADAGQFFYKRSNRNEIVHIDVFHQNGYVSHQHLAENIVNEIKIYQQLYPVQLSDIAQARLADYTDIQTATGGGRVSGSGRHGKGKSIRKNHLNHCHITILLKPVNYRLIMYLVHAAEKTILAQGLKLIRLKSITYEKRSVFKSVSEDFESPTDTMLHKKIKNSSDSQNNIDLDQLLSSLQDYSIITAEWDNLAVNSFDLGYHYDSIEDIRDKFKSKFRTETGNQKNKNIDQMIGTKQIFSTNTKAVKHYSDYTVVDNSLQYTNSYRSKNNFAGESGGALAVTKTVKNALIRNFSQENFRRGFSFNESDLRYYQKPRQSYRNFIFLFDCSASMKGARIKAAGILVDRLLSWSRDKVAIISVQENNTKLQRPFTRNRHQLLKTIEKLKPFGLTPLAEGLELSYDYLKSTAMYHAEVVLISDGVPTVSRYGDSPVTEARMAASKLKSDQIKFTCVGVEPNKHIMKKIAAAGGGKLFITKDLKEDVLLQIFRREHERIKQI